MQLGERLLITSEEISIRPEAHWISSLHDQGDENQMWLKYITVEPTAIKHITDELPDLRKDLQVVFGGTSWSWGRYMKAALTSFSPVPLRPPGDAPTPAASAV